MSQRNKLYLPPPLYIKKEGDMVCKKCLNSDLTFHPILSLLLNSEILGRSFTLSKIPYLQDKLKPFTPGTVKDKMRSCMKKLKC